MKHSAVLFLVAWFAVSAIPAEPPVAESIPLSATNAVSYPGDVNNEPRFVPKKAGKVRFALCQTPCGFFRPETRMDELFSWVRRGLRGDEDVIVFPELAFSSFSELSGSWRDSSEVWDKSAAFARERNAYVFVNHPERPHETESEWFNETRVFAPDGTIVATYRKRMLSKMDEAASFSPGLSPTIAPLPFARIGMLICKDAFVASGEDGDYDSADLLLVQFAHPGVDDVHAPEARWFPDCGRARADLNSSRFRWLRFGKPYLAVNKAGPDGNHILCGGSFVSDGSGEIIASAKALPEILFVSFAVGANGRINPVPSVR